MFENFWLLVSQRFGDKKIGFNSCVKFLNIATLMHSMFGILQKLILLIFNDTTFFLHFFPFFAFATQLFSTLVTSSNLRNQALLFIELRLFIGHHIKYSRLSLLDVMKYTV